MPRQGALSTTQDLISCYACRDTVATRLSLAMGNLIYTFDVNMYRSVQQEKLKL